MAVSDWTTAFENLPADTELVSQGAERIRTFKDLTREIIAVDHYLVPADESANTGQHNKVTLRAQDPIPEATSTNGVLYTAEVDYGDDDVQTELFYDNVDSSTVQLTRSGSAESIPSGSKMYFYQSAAPDGWTFDDTAALDDRILIGTNVVGEGGANLATGGDITSTSWTIAGITVDDHELSEAELPTHYHFLTGSTSTTTNLTSADQWMAKGGDGAIDFNYTLSGKDIGTVGFEPTRGRTSEVGSDEGHTHGLTIGAGWRPLCSVVILCIKDAYT